jgi:hypothetical protein
MPTVRVHADFTEAIAAIERLAADLKRGPAPRLPREALIAGAAAIAARPTKITRRALLGLSWVRRLTT